MTPLKMMRMSLSPLHIPKTFETSPNARSNAMKTALSQRRKDRIARPRIYSGNSAKSLAEPIKPEPTLGDVGDLTTYE